jgi:hypothetical protein
MILNMRFLTYLISAFAAITFCAGLKSQDPVPEGRALNIPFRRYGLSIGNSHEFNGIRINFLTKMSKE